MAERHPKPSRECGPPESARAADQVETTATRQGIPDDATFRTQGPVSGGDLEALLVQLLRVLAPAAAGHAAEAAPELSVSVSEGRALVQLLQAHGIAQGELGRLLGLEKSTVSRLAAGLEHKGWIRRGRDAGNQRYIRLYLTPAGSQVAARLLAAWQSRQARIIASLTDAERAGLAAGLGGLLRGLIAEGILGGPADADGTRAPARLPGAAGHPPR